MSRVLAVLVAGLALACGWAFMQREYHAGGIGSQSDEVVLAHRDSAYTGVTWVVSPGAGWLQLKFFERVEGGICTRPSWADLAALKQPDGSPLLPHLVPAAGYAHPLAPVYERWPAGAARPDPGTLNQSAYISLFPLGVLLNNRVMASAATSAAAAAPRILVVGLGSGAGLANLAHHFPRARITVVDIDAAVRDLVLEHYPLLRWLSTETIDGEPRLELVVRDARQYIRYEGPRRVAAGRGFDLLILDAYTAGSTIPPHLMTREFFAHCKDALTDQGILLANIIGCYGKDDGSGGRRGPQRLVLGGAIRSMRAAGLTEVWNFPVLQYLSEGSSTWEIDRTRNNIVVASRSPVDPIGNRTGWQRCERFVPFAELPSGRYRSASYVLLDERTDAEGTKRLHYGSDHIPAGLLDAALPELAAALALDPSIGEDYPHWQTRSQARDAGVIERACTAARALAKTPGSTIRAEGWNLPRPWGVVRFDDDRVLFPREVVRLALRVGRSNATPHSGEALTGPVDPPDGERPRDTVTWVMGDAPLFTDQTPNADIWNR